MNATNATSIQSSESVKREYGSVQSGSIKSIAKALQTVQSKMAAAVKDADNDFFHSKYATLNAVWQAVQPLLSEAGLSITQVPGATHYIGEDKHMDFETILMHSESGEFIKGLTMVNSGKSKGKNDPQSFGSAVTYARRYCLSSMMGIVVDDDDDANAASGKDQNQNNYQPHQNQQRQQQQRPPQNQQQRQPAQQGQQQPQTGQQQQAPNQAPQNQPATTQQPTACQRLGNFLTAAGCKGAEDANLLIDFIAPSHNWQTVQTEEIAKFVIDLVNEGITAKRFTPQTVLQTARASKDATATFT